MIFIILQFVSPLGGKFSEFSGLEIVLEFKVGGIHGIEYWQAKERGDFYTSQ